MLLRVELWHRAARGHFSGFTRAPLSAPLVHIFSSTGPQILAQLGRRQGARFCPRGAPPDSAAAACAAQYR